MTSDWLGLIVWLMALAGLLSCFGIMMAAAPELPAPAIDPATAERVLLHGDLSKLSPAQKIAYVRYLADTCGLNPLTQPFAFLTLNGREIVYAKREATEQLRRLHKVSLQIMSRGVVEDVYVVSARASLPDGRTDESTGAVAIAGLKGEARANAMMKAETKSKRRVTLSICGLGMLDESELDTLPAAVPLPSQPANAEPLAEAPALELPPGAVTITSVEKHPTKNPKVTRAVIKLSDSRSVATINDFLIGLAEQCQLEHVPVRVKTKPSKYGPDLVGLERADAQDLPLEPAPDDDDIPF
jgi:hypothetical protein